MNEIRIGWEPENQEPLAHIEQRLRLYTKGRGGASLLHNGTMLFIVSRGSDIEDAKKAMEQAKFLKDFKVVQMKEGGYFVGFHDALAVFVGKDEFENRKSEISHRIAELMLPGEKLFNLKNAPDDHLLIGLYGRGKLYRDVHRFSFYKRIQGD